MTAYIVTIQPVIGTTTTPLPAIIYGAACFSTIYNDSDTLASSIPRDSVQLALRSGITAFDTSPWYGDSEIVLGNALQAVADEFPRESYQIMTKCGRCAGVGFDYSPRAIRECVEASLKRLQTTYLDTVYLHDVEFICTPRAPSPTGHHSAALCNAAAAYGLDEGSEGCVLGDGDQKVLEAYNVLRQFKARGVVKRIGITGYPLPTLLRLCLLILHTPPFKPVDIVLSYCHLTLQNSTQLKFKSHFYERAKVGQVIAASPFSMGLLTARVPAWHPAPQDMKDISAKSLEGGEDLPDLALAYAIREARAAELPLVVGLSNPREVQECTRIWQDTVALAGHALQDRKEREEAVKQLFKAAGYLDWSWASP
ncbi:hypothetical protein FISHEDRAFT_48328 [Fistulina hepatica ATCC 64428]|uniref:NADP-dependent oxidoreductase domain-containing protein n=1 Tax=Fistulina hepatica ATCC 64428 TaxID=1128425 RepID=A0A0D7A4Q2_9AGAR|nr:hypothetical protein FISHEDRAFT_48328 [Fistulina hepatica ATCC 64428]